MSDLVKGINRDEAALILQGVDEGLPMRQAARRAGVGARRLEGLMAAGRADDAEGKNSELAVFARAIDQSDAENCRLHVVALRRIIDGDFEDAKRAQVQLNAITWSLARRWRADFSERAQLELAGEHGGPVAIKLYLPQLQPLPGANGAGGNGAQALPAADADDD